MVGARLIGVDWGTSSLRAYLLGQDGAVLGRVASPNGIMAVADGGFAAALDAAIGPWRAQGLPVLMSGMIGSRQGWREAPYVPAPASLADLAARIGPAEGGVPPIVPGIMQGGTLPGVMRGEETEIMGAADRIAAAGQVVLPGTHSKWVELRDGRIERFRTFMTGELFAVLRQHSILGRFAAAPPTPDGAATAGFLRGVDAVRDTKEGATALLFTARALVLTGQLAAEASLDYLSGVLIGDEIRTALAAGAGPVTLIGDAALCGRYREALARFDNEAFLIDDAAPAGLWRLAAAAGLVSQAAERDRRR